MLERIMRMFRKASVPAPATRPADEVAGELADLRRDSDKTVRDSRMIVREFRVIEQGRRR